MGGRVLAIPSGCYGSQNCQGSYKGNACTKRQTVIRATRGAGSRTTGTVADGPRVLFEEAVARTLHVEGIPGTVLN